MLRKAKKLNRYEIGNRYAPEDELITVNLSYAGF